MQLHWDDVEPVAIDQGGPARHAPAAGRGRGGHAHGPQPLLPALGQVPLRGIGVRFRVDRLDYWDGEPG